MKQHRMKSSRMNAIFAASAVAALALSGCAGADAGASTAGAESLAEMEPINFVYAEVGADIAVGGPFRAFAKEVSDASGGKITFEPYYAGSLVPATEGLSAVQNGTADMAFVSASWVPQDLPVAAWEANMASLASGEHPMGGIQGPSGQLDIALSSPELTAEYDAAGVKVLWSSAVTTRSFLMCTKPITSAADAKGKRVVVSGRVGEQEALSIGMIPVSLSVLEWYEGLQRGVVDCVATTPGGVTGTGIWEVAKHVVHTDFSGTAGSSVLVNKEVFEGMPLEAQRIFWDAMDTWVAERVSLSLHDSARIATEGKEKHGLQVHSLDDTLLDAVHARQTQNIAELMAAPPKGISDPKAFVDRTAATWDKWEKLISEELDVPLVTKGERTQAEIDSADIDVSKLAALLQKHAYGPHRP